MIIPLAHSSTRPVDPLSPPRGTRARSPRWLTVLINSGLLAAAVLAFASHELGATWHSVISIAVIGLVAWHATAQHRWIRSAARRRMRHPDRVLVVYNIVLASTFTIVNLSGLPVWFWGVRGVLLTAHEISGIAFVLMVLGHLGLNGRRLTTKLRRRARRPVPA